MVVYPISLKRPTLSMSDFAISVLADLLASYHDHFACNLLMVFQYFVSMVTLRKINLKGNECMPGDETSNQIRCRVACVGGGF